MVVSSLMEVVAGRGGGGGGAVGGICTAVTTSSCGGATSGVSSCASAYVGHGEARRARGSVLRTKMKSRRGWWPLRASQRSNWEGIRKAAVFSAQWRVESSLEWQQQKDENQYPGAGNGSLSCSAGGRAKAGKRLAPRAHGARDETELFFQGEDREAWRVSSYGDQLPNQAETVAGGTTIQAEFKSLPDLDYLQELLAIQQSGPRAIGFFGTRNMGFMHQQLIEILSYAMVITKNHIYTSGASGTNAAVIRGALRAEMPELLTVILPQSLQKQPPESQDLLSKVKNVIEMPHNDHLPLMEASRLCNMDILSHVQQVICFAFHDSNLLMETCREAKNLRKIVTLFYLD